MLVEGKKVVELYFTDAQIRLLKSRGVECHYHRFVLEPQRVVRYMVRFPEDPAAIKIYLTDWQKREVMDEAGEACEFLELSEASIIDYGVPAEKHP